MNILIYDINYAPELTGVGRYTGEMGGWLAQQGHTVRVITGMPYYPEWKVHKKYRGKLWFTETIEGATVNRCPFYVPAKVTSLTRILHEFSFVASSLIYWFGIFFAKRYDVVICISPPFHIGILPVIYTRLRKVPLWCHIQDLQIDMAKELKMFKNKNFLKLLFMVEEFILKRCTIVSTISEGMVRKVAQKNVVQSTCLLFPNWVDETAIRPLPREESLRKELGLSEDDKVIMYSGSLGEKQGLELIIEAASHFAGKSNVKFLIFGAGGAKSSLESLVKDRKLTNVWFHPLQPYNKLSALLATADIHLVLQKKSASDLVLPSKLTGILAAGGCALVSATPGTSLYDIINRHQIGMLIEPESSEALIMGINKALSMDLSELKNKARTFAKNNLEKQAILQQFERELLSLKKRNEFDPEISLARPMEPGQATIVSMGKQVG